MSKEEKPELTPSLGLLAPGIELIRNNLLVFAVLYVLPFVVYTIGLFFMFPLMVDENWAGVASIFVVIMLLSLLIYPATLYFYTQAAKGKEVTIQETFSKGLPKLWTLIGLSILTSLVVFGGLLLLIIPGIIMLRRYFLAPYYVIDRNLGVIDAMKTSAKESREFSWSIYGIFGVNILFGLLGIIPVVGGIVGSILQALYVPAPAIRYHEIKKAYKAL